MPANNFLALKNSALSYFFLCGFRVCLFFDAGFTHQYLAHIFFLGEIMS